MCGYDAGSVEDDPAEDDDFELDLEAVDVVSFALAVVSLGFNALVSDSMSVATSLGMSFTDGQQIKSQPAVHRAHWRG